MAGSQQPAPPSCGPSEVPTTRPPLVALASTDYGSLLFSAYRSLCCCHLGHHRTRLLLQLGLSHLRFQCRPLLSCKCPSTQSRCWGQGRRQPWVAACSPEVSPPPPLSFLACDESADPAPLTAWDETDPAHPRCPCQQEGGGRTLALAVDLRDPMGNRFDSNMTQEVSGREGQLGSVPGIPPAPAEAWPTQTLCSASASASQQRWPSPR